MKLPVLQFIGLMIGGVFTLVGFAGVLGGFIESIADRIDCIYAEWPWENGFGICSIAMFVFGCVVLLISILWL